MNITFPKTRMILNESPPKNDFWPFFSFLALSRVTLGYWGQKTAPERPDGHQKTEDIQRYLKIWGRYDSIESGLSELKKGGYVGVAQKKKNFEPKMGLGACPEARHTMLSTQTSFLSGVLL